MKRYRYRCTDVQYGTPCLEINRLFTHAGSIKSWDSDMLAVYYSAALVEWGIRYRTEMPISLASSGITVKTDSTTYHVTKMDQKRLFCTCQTN